MPTWSNFRPGIAQYGYGDLQKGLSWCENVDTYSDPYCAELDTPILTEATPAPEIRSILDISYMVPGMSGVVMCGNGKVYYKGVEVRSSAYLYRGVAYNMEIVGGVEKHYLYFIFVDTTGSAGAGIERCECDITTDVLFDFQLPSIPTTGFNTGVRPKLRPSTGKDGSYSIPIVYTNAEIYFGLENVVFSIDLVGTCSLKFFIGNNQRITGITAFQDMINVYARSGNTGFKYIYDPVRDGSIPGNIVEWRSMPVLGATNIGDTDYIVAGLQNNIDIYTSTGLRRSLFFSNKDVKPAGGGLLLGVCPIISIVDDIYLALEGGKVLAINRYYDDIPTISVSSSTDLKEIHCFGASQYKYFIGGVKNPSGGIIASKRLVKDTYSGGTGNIVSQLDISPYGEKDLEEVLYHFENQGTYEGTITISARKKTNDAWILLKTLAPGATLHGKITKNTLRAKGFSKYDTIQWKIGFTAAGAKTPRFYYLSYNERTNINR